MQKLRSKYCVNDLCSLLWIIYWNVAPQNIVSKTCVVCPSKFVIGHVYNWAIAMGLTVKHLTLIPWKQRLVIEKLIQFLLVFFNKKWATDILSGDINTAQGTLYRINWSPSPHFGCSNSHCHHDHSRYHTHMPIFWVSERNPCWRSWALTLGTICNIANAATNIVTIVSGA